jgi:hypothetical protein
MSIPNTSDTGVLIKGWCGLKNRDALNAFKVYFLMNLGVAKKNEEIS